MSIVPLNSSDEKNISASILNFLTTYGVISLLCKCGGTKLKGVPVKALFTYTLTNVFRMGSFYMQNKMGQIREGFSKNTYYRFLMAHAPIGFASPRCFLRRSSTGISVH